MFRPKRPKTFPCPAARPCIGHIREYPLPPLPLPPRVSLPKKKRLLIFTYTIFCFCIQCRSYLLLQFNPSFLRYFRLAHKDWNLILLPQTPANEPVTQKDTSFINTNAISNFLLNLFRRHLKILSCECNIFYHCEIKRNWHVKGTMILREKLYLSDLLKPINADFALLKLI